MIPEQPISIIPHLMVATEFEMTSEPSPMLREAAPQTLILMKKNIELSPNIEALFGTRDENLHVLEDGLNINIDMRSDHIELEGAPRDVARRRTIIC